MSTSLCNEATCIAAATVFGIHETLGSSMHCACNLFMRGILVILVAFVWQVLQDILVFIYCVGVYKYSIHRVDKKTDFYNLL
mmetsp:Transcript_7132/g.14320  ORF Transcript_7132/g.14320 Transcript_7132/m.14320 type:complete len:82 (+) Transcript_7132:598-843(+)